LLLFSTLLQASDNGVVKGVVLDTLGQALPGTQATLSATGSEAPPLMLVCDVQGAFEFTGLADGSYALHVSLPGFQEQTVNVDIAGGPPIAVEIVLDLAVLSETVTVYAEVKKLVEVETPSGEAEVEEDVLLYAPLVEENYDNALPLLPGVVRGPNGLINMNGARSNQSGFRLGGADVTDPLTGETTFSPPLEAVESLEVFQNTYTAEYGRVASGTIDALTRAGGDEWKYQVHNMFPRFRFDGVTIHGVDKFAPRVQVGGPLVPDKLFISQSFTYFFQRSRVKDLKDALGFAFSEEILEGVSALTRLDYQVNPRHRLTGILSLSPTDIDSVGISTLQSFEASPDLETRGFNAVVTEQAILGKSILETQVSVQKFDVDVRPKSGETAVVTVTGNFDNYFNHLDRDSLQVQWRQSFLTPMRNRLGDHSVKIGYDVLYSDYDGIDASLPVDVLRADGSRFQGIDWSGSPEGGASNTQYAAFLQDRWRPSRRLQLDLGLRYDHERIAKEHHVAPRASFSLSPSASEKTVFKGGAGLFYDKLFLNIDDYRRRQRRVETPFGPDGVTPSGPALVFQNTVEGGEIDVPLSKNWNLEVDRSINRTLAVRVKYSERHGSNESIIDYLPSGPNGPELRLSSRGRSRARELEVTARTRWGSQNELIFSYAYSKAEADLNDFVSVFGNRRSAILVPNEFSLQPFNAPHRFLSWGLLQVPKNVIFSYVLEVREGFPFTIVDESQQPVGGRNRGGRFPSLATLDVRFDKLVKLHINDWSARIGFQIFNVLDRFNPRDVQNNLASPIFGTLTNTVDREFRLKFILVF